MKMVIKRHQDKDSVQNFDCDNHIQCCSVGVFINDLTKIIFVPDTAAENLFEN